MVLLLNSQIGLLENLTRVGERKTACHFTPDKATTGTTSTVTNLCTTFVNTSMFINYLLLDFSLTVEAAPHECVIRTSQP